MYSNNNVISFVTNDKTSGGSRISRWGGANLQHGHFLAKMYARTKELDPVGGRAGGAP